MEIYELVQENPGLNDLTDKVKYNKIKKMHKLTINVFPDCVYYIVNPGGHCAGYNCASDWWLDEKRLNGDMSEEEYKKLRIGLVEEHDHDLFITVGGDYKNISTNSSTNNIEIIKQFRDLIQFMLENPQLNFTFRIGEIFPGVGENILYVKENLTEEEKNNNDEIVKKFNTIINNYKPTPVIEKKEELNLKPKQRILTRILRPFRRV